MPRALDHIVWPARDLEGLAETFRRLGFTVGSRNRHPWGTENHIVQFDGTFLELLGFAGDYRSVPESDPSFPFAGFCESYLRQAESGVAMVVLRSDDAAADADRLRREGLGLGRMLPFSRNAQAPDGTDRTVAFTIAFADLPGLPNLGVFLCEQHRPENFWNADAQVHANGAGGIIGLTVRAADPATGVHAIRRLAASNLDEAESVIDLDGGCRIVVEAKTGADRIEVPAVDLWVSDLVRVETGLQAGSFEYSTNADSLTVRSPALGRTALVFRRKPE